MHVAPSISKQEHHTVGKPAEPDFEVLPPEGHHNFGDRIKGRALAWIIQYVMDNLLRVPGTKARIGLTPFMEIVPGLGDGAAAVISAFTIIEGARRRVPKIVLARMGLNVLLNALIGMIPAVGEVFSFWFKPSYRNYLLLQKHGAGDAKVVGSGANRRDWIFVIGLLTLLFVFVALFIGVGAYIFWQMLNYVVQL